MKQFLVLLLCSGVLQAGAQSAAFQKNRVQFSSTTQAVHLEGAAGSAFAVQSVNGTRYKGWTLAVGAGLDGYGMRSYPVFLHLRRQLPLKVPLFLYADGGRNYVWPKEDEIFWGVRPDYQHGWYWDGGVQYHLALRGQAALAFSAGYSQKTYSEETTASIWCIDGPCPEQKNSREYLYRRISLKAGIHF